MSSIRLNCLSESTAKHLQEVIQKEIELLNQTTLSTYAQEKLEALEYINRMINNGLRSN